MRESLQSAYNQNSECTFRKTHLYLQKMKIMASGLVILIQGKKHGSFDWMKII